MTAKIVIWNFEDEADFMRAIGILAQESLLRPIDAGVMLLPQSQNEVFEQIQ
jgi:hypothetical protein